MAEEQLAYKYYLISYPLKTSLEIRSVHWLLLPNFLPPADKVKIILTKPNGDKIDKEDGGTTASPYWKFNEILDQQGTYLLQYFRDNKIYLHYYFSVVENKLPLKKWTITSVVGRLLDVCEPLRRGELPRFRLNEAQAALFDKIVAPEFSFTKQTLRECLQEVGKVVHGEPRLTPKKANDSIRTEYFSGGRAYLGGSPDPYDYYNGNYIVYVNGKKYPITMGSEADGGSDDYYLDIDGLSYTGELNVYNSDSYENGTWFYEVSYDLYASQERSGIYTVPAKLKNVYSQIESYTSNLDSNAENLVNQLDKFSGVIVEPYRDGAKTVRTENAYVRIEDNNMIIATQYPIYAVDKLEYVYADGNTVKSVDITPWLFEKSIYDTQLSSYDEQYPYSKAYGLYYSQGNKNIGGLNFKVDAAAFEAYKNYAIINILKQATGNSNFSVSDYPTMAFRVTYTPIYNARVAQTKVNYKDFPRAAGLIFNQASNIIESRYYGENLKGAIARLGNVELSYTYTLAKLSQIPKAGQMYNDDFYISAVAVEYLPTCLKCTIGLSKDFNRLSAYIGVNSAKRYSEISQGQAVERNTLWREYIVVGDQEEPDSDCLMGTNMLIAIAGTFTQAREIRPLTNVCAWGQSYQENDLNAVNLPVISSAFGNSISFSWQYEDNYSAGAVSVPKDNAIKQGENNVRGYFQDSCRYTDYYGRLYYYNFDLEPKGPNVIGSNLTETALKLPQGSKPLFQSSGFVSTAFRTPYILRKDNREALQCNFQIDFVTNSDIIIGSALASYCPAVRGSDSSLKAKLYVFPTELNKFTDHIEAWEDVDLSTLPSIDINVSVYDGYFTVSAASFPTGGKSWAIVTSQYKKNAEQVEDEFGNISTQQEVYGGDLLIGQNKEVTAGQAFTPIYFTKKRKIFDETVWKDRR